jgi:hypothetical protein
MLIAWPPALSAYTSVALLGIAPELEELLEELEELEELDELEEFDELLEDDVELFDEDELLELDELLAAGVPPQPTSAAANKAAQMRRGNLGNCIMWTPNYCFEPKWLMVVCPPTLVTPFNLYRLAFLYF